MKAARQAARGLRFTEGNHRYTLDGKPVPSVTTILGVLDKPAIPKWAAKTVAEYVAQNPDAIETLRSLGENGMAKALADVPWKKMSDAGARGTTLHDYADRLLREEEVDVEDDLVPVIEHALQFLEDWAIDPIIVEQPVAHRGDWWAGKPDLIASFADPNSGRTGIGIFDWKSGKAMYPEYAWQLAAYGHAEFSMIGDDESPLPQIGASFGVQIRADGYDVFPFKYGPDVYAEFVAIRNVYSVVKAGRGDWKTPGTGHVGIAIRKGDAA
jgi:hypothetical protein